MKEISGTLDGIGSGTVTMTTIGKSFVKFDTIEIGDHVLQNIRTARTLGNFLEKGLNSPVTLYLNGKFLVGVKLQNGKIYFWRRNTALFVILALIFFAVSIELFFTTGYFFLPFLALMAVYYLMLRNELTHVFSCQPKLASAGGVPLKS